MTNLVFEKQSQVLAANDQWKLGIGGDFVRLAQCDWPVTVRLYKGNREIGAMANMLAGDYVRDVDFDAVRVDNGASGQTVTVQIAGGGVGSDRVLGEVSVIDGGKSRTLAGLSFLANGYVAASVGNYSHVQLWNPTATKNLVVKQLFFSEPANGIFNIKAHNAALLTLFNNPLPKKMGAAVSSAEVRTQAAAAAIGVAAMMSGNILASATLKIEFQEPLIIPPGWGLVFHGNVNEQVNVAIDFYEDPV